MKVYLSYGEYSEYVQHFMEKNCSSLAEVMMSYSIAEALIKQIWVVFDDEIIKQSLKKNFTYFRKV